MSCPISDEMHNAIGQYEAWLRAGGSAERTIDARVRAVRRLAAHADVDPLTLTPMQIATWVGSVPAAWSRATYRSHARAWCDFLITAGLRDDNPMARVPRPRTPRAAPKPISDRDLTLALIAASGHARMMILLGAYAGLRVHEIAKIRGEDVTHESLRVLGKGGVEACIPTHPLIWQEAQRYPRDGFWFPSQSGPGRPMHPSAIYGIIRRTLRYIGSDGHPHQLRHWFGTNALRAAGGNLRVAQELLRHSSPATTARYTRVESTERTAAVSALPVLTVNAESAPA